MFLLGRFGNPVKGGAFTIKSKCISLWVYNGTEEHKETDEM